MLTFKNVLKSLRYMFEIYIFLFIARERCRRPAPRFHVFLAYDIHTTRTAIANEQVSFILKRVTSNRMPASSIVTEKKSTKHRKLSLIYGRLKLYFDKKSYRQVSKIILVYIYVVFRAIFFLLFKIRRIYFCV
jgi:hypothetical protein